MTVLVHVLHICCSSSVVVDDTLKHALAAQSHFQKSAYFFSFAFDTMTERGKHALGTLRGGDPRLKIRQLFPPYIHSSLSLSLFHWHVHSSLLNPFLHSSSSLPLASHNHHFFFPLCCNSFMFISLPFYIFLFCSFSLYVLSVCSAIFNQPFSAVILPSWLQLYS